MFISIDLRHGSDDDFLFFCGMSSKPHLSSIDGRSRLTYRDSELVFSLRVRHIPKGLFWETAVLRTSDACMSAL